MRDSILCQHGVSSLLAHVREKLPISPGVGGPTSPLEGTGRCVLPTEPDWPGRAQRMGAGLDPGRQPRRTLGWSHNALRVTRLGAAGPGSTGTDRPCPVLVSFLLGSLEPQAGRLAHSASRYGPGP